MESWVLITIIVAVVVIALAAILFGLVYYYQHKKTKRRLAEAEALYGAKQEEELAKKNKKNWRQRLVTRKTIRLPKVKSFMSPNTGDIRTETVQPDALKSGSKINQQLGYSHESQREPLLQKGNTFGSSMSEDYSCTGGIDVSQFSPIIGFKVEMADDHNEAPSNKNQNLGSILFALKYEYDQQNLQLRIVRAKSLPAKDLGGTSDPYVRAVITPSREKYVLETKKKMKNLNPEWKETFSFEGFPLSKLENKSLVLQVLDFDMFSKDDPIGEVELQLGSVNFLQPNIFHLYLSPCTGDRRGLGELMVSLSYNDSASHLTVVIVRARNLKAKDMNGLSDPYVKVYLLYQNEKIEKRKTKIVMKNLHPSFNESFQFSVPRERIKDSGLHIIVNDYDKWGKNEKIGELVLSSRSGTQEIKHWNETLYKQNQMVSEWHALKKLKESRYHRTSSSTKPP